MTNEETVARAGLDVTGYFGKWGKAQELAEYNERRDGYELLPYWERVRLEFLELGGKYASPVIKR